MAEVARRTLGEGSEDSAVTRPVLQHLFRGSSSMFTRALGWKAEEVEGFDEKVVKEVQGSEKHKCMDV